MTTHRFDSLSKAISLIAPNSRIFVHGGAATPNELLKELNQQSDRLKEATLIHLHTEGPALYGQSSTRFKVVNLFVGHNFRKLLDYDRIDYLPCFLSEIPALFRSRQCPLDVALLNVSPPDRYGYCSLGVSVDIAKAAAESASVLIAQVNPNMPRTAGDGFLHVDMFDSLVRSMSHLQKLNHAFLTRTNCKLRSSFRI